jgi:hypothetical protein
MTNSQRRISHQRDMTQPNLRMATQKREDGVWEATVVGQEHVLKATGSTDMEAVRALKRLTHEKLTSGDVGDLRQSMV